MELYGINMNEFAKECQKGVAASTSITTIPGRKSRQLMVQGNQIAFVGNLLMSKYFNTLTILCHLLYFYLFRCCISFSKDPHSYLLDNMSSRYWLTFQIQNFCFFGFLKNIQAYVITSLFLIFNFDIHLLWNKNEYRMLSF